MRDLYFIPVEEGLLAYAPLRNLAVRMTWSQYEDASVRARILDENGFGMEFRFPVDPLQVGAFSLDALDGLTIGLTNACNLRCGYCYADGGEHHANMPEEIQEKILTMIEKGFMHHGRFQVYFMGDGETMTRASTFFRMVERIRRISPSIGVQLVTNATLIGNKEARRLKDLGVEVQVSYDPLDGGRVYEGGRPSNADVEQALRTLEAHGVPLYVRSTITSRMASRMEDMVRRVHEIAPSVTSASFEPVGICSRTSDTNDASVFLESFRRARELGKQLGVCLSNSGRRETIKCSPAFCGTVAPSVTITAEGLITACSRATRMDQATYSEKYIYGRYDFEVHDWVIDHDKIRALRETTTVSAYPECEDCAARWNCSGGCAIKRDAGEDVCSINYSLFVDLLLETYEKRGFWNQTKRNSSTPGIRTSTIPGPANNWSGSYGSRSPRSDLAYSSHDNPT